MFSSQFTFVKFVVYLTTMKGLAVRIKNSPQSLVFKVVIAVNIRRKKAL
jgi:hypothetical protein